MKQQGEKKPGAPTPTIRNRRASYEYQFIDTYVAGIVLTGTEIKSIRLGKVILEDAFCTFNGAELLVVNLQISPYSFGSFSNHDPKRQRKLLLKHRELTQLKRGSEEKGLTIIVTKLFFNPRGLAKLEIALAKGKKLYDKRESIKSRDVTRDALRDDA